MRVECSRDRGTVPDAARRTHGRQHRPARFSHRAAARRRVSRARPATACQLDLGRGLAATRAHHSSTAGVVRGAARHSPSPARPDGSGTGTARPQAWGHSRSSVAHGRLTPIECKLWRRGPGIRLQRHLGERQLLGRVRRAVRNERGAANGARRRHPSATGRCSMRRPASTPRDAWCPARMDLREARDRSCTMTALGGARFAPGRSAGRCRRRPGAGSAARHVNGRDPCRRPRRGSRSQAEHQHARCPAAIFCPADLGVASPSAVQMIGDVAQDLLDRRSISSGFARSRSSCGAHGRQHAAEIALYCRRPAAAS